MNSTEPIPLAAPAQAEPEDLSVAYFMGLHAAKRAHQPAAQALDNVRVFWQQHTQADALSMTMAELHDDVEHVIRAARGAAPSNGALAAPAQPRDDAVFVVWWSDHMPNSTEADAWAEWCALRSNQPTAQAGWCDGCSPDNCGGCMTSAAPAQAAPVDAPHSTACLYHYALSRLGLWDNAGLRVLFWDAHNSLSWDTKTDWYVMPDADKADCERCNAAIAAQKGTND